MSAHIDSGKGPPECLPGSSSPVALATAGGHVTTPVAAALGGGPGLR